MRFIHLFLAILVFVSFSWAIEVIEPIIIKDVSDGQTIGLGEIGPGQTIPVSIHPKVYAGGKFGSGGRYDFARVVQLPFGWKAEDSKIYGDPLQVKITADKNSPEGEYETKITVYDEGNGELLENITFTAKIKIIHDVLDVSVSPYSITVGPGQPARYSILITNKGTASDVFNVYTSGVPRWVFEKPVLVPAMSSKTVIYEITESEEERYFPEITVESTSSSLIKQKEEVIFTVQPNLLSDFKSTNHGILVFPVFEAPAYAFAGLISNLWE